MSSFSQVIQPTPYGFFDNDAAFQAEADSIVTFIRRKLGDDTVSVELSKRQIWACLEEATLEFGALINQYQVKSELASLLGMATGSLSGSTGLYPRQTLEFLMRQAEPYATYAGSGGAYDSSLCYIDLIDGQQDYNIYTDVIDPDTSTGYFQNLPSGSQSKIRVLEVMHFSPLAAQHFLLNASNVTNFLASEFSYESYVNSTVFYVLPIFEDVLRRGMLEAAARVRRSNYSYQIMGRSLRIYPVPSLGRPGGVNKLWLRVANAPDPLNPSFHDDTIYGVSNMSNVPYGNIDFSKINSIGRQWIREYALCLAKEILGQVRSKMKSIPIPNGDLQLNGDDLLQQAKDDKERMRTEIRELLDSLTYTELLKREAERAQALNSVLQFVPMAVGKAVYVG